MQFSIIFLIFLNERLPLKNHQKFILYNLMISLSWLVKFLTLSLFLRTVVILEVAKTVYLKVTKEVSRLKCLSVRSHNNNKTAAILQSCQKIKETSYNIKQTFWWISTSEFFFFNFGHLGCKNSLPNQECQGTYLLLLPTLDLSQWGAS